MHVSFSEDDKRLLAEAVADQVIRRIGVRLDRNAVAESPILPLLVSVKEAARMLGVSERTLWSITHPRGELPVVRVQSRTMYARQDIEAWIERSKQRAEKN